MIINELKFWDCPKQSKMLLQLLQYVDSISINILYIVKSIAVNTKVKSSYI